MSYSENHPPSYAVLSRVLREATRRRQAQDGWIVTFHWPEKRVFGHQHLTNECGHVHRSWYGAHTCAQKRTDDVRDVLSTT